MKFRFGSMKTKLLASAGLLGIAAAVAGLGTYGTFTSTTSSSQTDTSGTVNIALGAAGTATNRLTIGASGLVPGDIIQRQVQLTDSGNQNLAGVALTSSAAPSSLLDSDATNGLQMTVQSCPTAWIEAGTAPTYTYTCSGSAATVLTSRPVIGSNVNLPSLNALNAGGVDNLLFTLSFPGSAGNTFQGLTSTINFSFTGTQRAGTSK
jgi:hypothetical protein